MDYTDWILKRLHGNYVSLVYIYFFFQAEDGIRDLTVTGVQTCALPIWQERFPINLSFLSAKAKRSYCGGSSTKPVLVPLEELLSRSIENTESGSAVL